MSYSNYSNYNSYNSYKKCCRTVGKICVISFTKSATLGIVSLIDYA